MAYYGWQKFQEWLHDRIALQVSDQVGALQIEKEA
jgi:hypothetical protein